MSESWVLDEGEGPEEMNPHFDAAVALFYQDKPKCCLFSPKFCLNVPMNLRMKEKLGINKDDCYKIYGTNNNHNKEYFKVSNPMNTMRGKHILSDNNGEELCKMKKKLLSMHPTWHLNSGHKLESRLATMVFEFTLLKKKAHIYCYNQPYPQEDDDTKYDHLTPTLYIKSDSLGKDFKVYCNETDEVFAGATKASKGMDSLVDKDDYFLEIKEGVDVLFMTSLALMYEYALSDIES